MNNPMQRAERVRALDAIQSAIDDPHALVDIVRNAATIDDAIEAVAQAFSTDLISARVVLLTPFSILAAARSAHIADELASHLE